MSALCPGVEQPEEDAPRVGRGGPAGRRGDVGRRDGVGPRGDRQVEEAAQPRHGPRRRTHGRGRVSGGAGGVPGWRQIL